MTTRITTPFGFASTADEVVEGIDLTGRRAIVTGASSGIGVETVRALARTGAEVTLAVRDTAAGERTARDVTASTGNPAIRVERLDVADLASVQAFVERWDGPVHVLVNNAGVMAVPELRRTGEGWENQFATNHMGHFALTTGLHPALAAEGARVVAVSSSGHLISPVVFDDLHFLFRPYDPLVAYGQSKTAVVQFAVAASARWSGDGVTVNAVMPGAIATNLQRHTGGLRTPEERRKTPQQGASTTLVVATSPLLDGVGGRYFEDGSEAQVVHDANGWSAGVADYAIDPANADRLWDVSHRLLSAATGSRAAHAV
ncbi:SDR family NAD(P)-dependent oxidoreductase [Streptomyces sp. NPDC013178]|uniref:SDR family NAD(P)-dependent oxidoreductase n=1 Tax=Streptomyces sp. NPDC013178 TaxID=3155118 RepID=UPI00340CAEA8